MIDMKAAVAKPLQCASRVERCGAELVVLRRPSGWPIGDVFDFLWLIGWTVG